MSLWWASGSAGRRSPDDLPKPDSRSSVSKPSSSAGSARIGRACPARWRFAPRTFWPKRRGSTVSRDGLTPYRTGPWWPNASGSKPPTTGTTRRAVERFTSKGGHFVRGRGRLVGPGLVSVDEQTYRARTGVVLAAGSTAVVPPVEGLVDTPYWTNRQLFSAKELPDSLLVLGGGSIGLETAQALNRFGVEVHVVEAAERLLTAEEPETSALMREVLSGDGVTIHCGVPAVAVEHDGRFTMTLSNGIVSSPMNCWSVQVGAHNFERWVWRPSDWTPRHPRSRPMKGCAQDKACGRWGTLPNTVDSRTWRCTRPM